VSSGTRFTARLDRPLGTDSSRPGDTFTAYVATPVVSSCGSDFILKGAPLRGRVASAEPGATPTLALEVIDVETSAGLKPIPAAIRSSAGLTWSEASAPGADSSYHAVVLYPSWGMAPPQGRDLQLTLAAGSLIELELVKPVLVLP
jgi:hypothetical protein